MLHTEFGVSKMAIKPQNIAYKNRKNPHVYWYLGDFNGKEICCFNMLQISRDIDEASKKSAKFLKQLGARSGRRFLAVYPRLLGQRRPISTEAGCLRRSRR
jgi:hypothetical protein